MKQDTRTIYLAAFVGVLMITGSILYADRKYSVNGIIGSSSKTKNTQLENDSPIVNEPLLGTEWVWLHTERPNGDLISTPKRESYVLTLKDGRVTSSTDCNSLSSEYALNGEVLSFKPFAMTKMYCEGSMESTYVKDLALTTSYEIIGTRMYINLNRDVGRMVFEKK